METTGMKCNILFSGKIYHQLSSAEFAQRVVTVNVPILTAADSILILLLFQKTIRLAR